MSSLISCQDVHLQERIRAADFPIGIEAVAGRQLGPIGVPGAVVLQLYRESTTAGNAGIEERRTWRPNARSSAM